MKKSYGHILFAIGILSFISCKKNEQAPIKNEQLNSKPNIVIIYADDMGTLDAGCYGVKDIKTPAIDKLASEGVRFTQAYAHTVCCPSRAALMTGRAPQRGGVNQWTSCHPADKDGRVLDLKEVTMAEHFKDNGYKTGLVGKWHLGATMDHGPLDQGFDTFFGFRGGFIDYYSHRFLHAKWQRPQFHDLYKGKEEVFRDGTYFPEMQMQEAEQFIETNKNDPFFLYLALNLPHYPEQPDPKFADTYKDLKWPRNSYAPMIATVDDKVGQVMAMLEQRGLKENTIVIFQSDNGHSTEDYYNWDVSYGGNGGGGYTGKWRGAKGSFFEGGLRVPAIISYPKSLPKGAVRDQAIVNMDWFPTLCELAGMPQPNVSLDGKSIVSVLQSETVESPHKVMHWMWQHMWAVRKGNWKLIYKGHDTTGKYSTHPEGSFEMPEFHLANLDEENPEEKNHAAEQTAIVAELLALHEAWAKEVFDGSGYPDPNKVTETVEAKKKGTTKL